jgi:hypothetical protein
MFSKSNFFIDKGSKIVLMEPHIRHYIASKFLRPQKVLVFHDTTLKILNLPGENLRQLCYCHTFGLPMLEKGSFYVHHKILKINITDGSAKFILPIA